MLRYTQIHAQLQQMLYVTLIHVLNTSPLFTVYHIYTNSIFISNKLYIQFHSDFIVYSSQTSYIFSFIVILS